MVKFKRCYTSIDESGYAERIFTFATEIDRNAKTLKFQYAICSPYDPMVKKVGNALASERLVSNPYVINLIDDDMITHFSLVWLILEYIFKNLIHTSDDRHILTGLRKDLHWYRKMALNERNDRFLKERKAQL